ncbi:MAG: HEAT repeat domain-containing protein [Candidatus Neomarinimicrobiota bacterium]
MAPIRDILNTLILQDRIFLLLGLTVAILLVLVMIFAILTILLRLRNIRTAELWGQLEARWEPIILDVMTGDRSPADVHRFVGAGEAFYFLDYLMRFANRFRGQEAAVISDLARPYLSGLVDRLPTADPPRRAHAIRTLSILGMPDYAQIVVQALDDPSPLVAMIAARALARKNQPQYARELLARLDRFDTWSLNYMISMLAGMGAEIAPELRRTLADTELLSQTRAVAAGALRELNDYESGQIAAQVLETETDRELLAASLRLVGDVGSPEFLDPIRRLCRNDDAVVRGLAMRALGRLGKSEDLPLLRDGMEDESQWVALHAARGLRQVGGDHLLEELLAAGHLQGDLVRQVLAEGRSS